MFHCREQVQTHARGFGEENYAEAAASALYAFATKDVPSEIAALLSDPSCNHVGAGDTPTSPFWVVMRALRDFVAETGSLPLPGSISDMTGDT
eukprot:SAG11_NODE_4196_length_2020_cov_1.121291_1_plen_92_part_10